MVGFRNNAGSAPLTNWVAPTPQQIAFGRGEPSSLRFYYCLSIANLFNVAGSMGFVAINNMDSTWTATFQTSVHPGSFCDVVHGAAMGGTCTGPSYGICSLY